MADLKGLKRICMSCGARFYDLNKKPIICPSCNVEYTGEIKVKSRRGRLPSEITDSPVEEETAVVETVEDDNTEEIESDEETVSLDELDEESDDGDDEESIELDEDDLDIEDLDDDDIDDDDIDEDIAEEDEEK